MKRRDGSSECCEQSHTSLGAFLAAPRSTFASGPCWHGPVEISGRTESQADAAFVFVTYLLMPGFCLPKSSRGFCLVGAVLEIKPMWLPIRRSLILQVLRCPAQRPPTCPCKESALRDCSGSLSPLCLGTAAQMYWNLMHPCLPVMDGVSQPQLPCPLRGKFLWGLFIAYRLPEFLRGDRIWLSTVVTGCPL